MLAEITEKKYINEIYLRNKYIDFGSHQCHSHMTEMTQGWCMKHISRSTIWSKCYRRA